MDIKFSKDTNENRQAAASGDKVRLGPILVALLILVGGFCYIYFFTDLIRSQEEQKPAEAPATQVVKKALPLRDTTAPTAAQPGTSEPKQTQVVQVKQDAKNPKVSAAVTAPAKETVKPPEESKKSALPKPPEKKPVPAAVEKKELKPVAEKPVVKKQDLAEKKPAPPVATIEKKETPPQKTVPALEKKPMKAKSELSGKTWILFVGSYMLEDALSADLLRVRKAGLDAAVEPGPKKKTQMNRLLLADYDDRGEARGNLEKLKQYTSDAFIIEQGGKFSIYAGSYLLDARAIAEKERLGALGFTLTMKRVEIAIPTRKLTAGTFNDRKSAESAYKKLKDAGINATLSAQ